MTERTLSPKLISRSLWSQDFRGYTAQNHTLTLHHEQDVALLASYRFWQAAIIAPSMTGERPQCTSEPSSLPYTFWQALCLVANGISFPGHFIRCHFEHRFSVQCSNYICTDQDHITLWWHIVEKEIMKVFLSLDRHFSPFHSLFWKCQTFFSIKLRNNHLL